MPHSSCLRVQMLMLPSKAQWEPSSGVPDRYILFHAIHVHITFQVPIGKISESLFPSICMSIYIYIVCTSNTFYVACEAKKWYNFSVGLKLPRTLKL